ncbi:MAG: serine kinase [Halanaerobiales bacterium]|nr:serine kinase [Halanaerobiales bacterium]
MNINGLLEKIPMKVVVRGDLEQEVTGGYISDLLSHVMANGQEGNVWITLQSHQNIIAVGSLINFAAIIVACGMPIDKNTIEKAEKEGITLLSTDEGIYEIAGKINSLGI